MRRPKHAAARSPRGRVPAAALGFALGAAAGWAVFSGAVVPAPIGPASDEVTAAQTPSSPDPAAVSSETPSPLSAPLAAPPAIVAEPTTTSVPPPTVPSLASFDAAAHSVTDAASPWVVVNKLNPLDPLDYASSDIVTFRGARISETMAADLAAMMDAAAADGVGLPIRTAYRSYADQTWVHEQTVARYGSREQAEAVSARPGYSEHQTGLAVDFGSLTNPSCNLRACYAQTEEGRWLAENVTAFGFLIRYREDNTEVTGYAAEGWHVRYVGRELAAEMQRRGVTTLEEFFGVDGGDYS